MALVTISYQDLLDFCEEGNSNDSLRQRLVNDIGRAYGSNGLGILSVSGVPGFVELRERLLPLAAKVSELPPEDLDSCVSEKACYAVGWSHGKEELTPGVPDLSKGSFYANPLVNDLVAAMMQRLHQNSNDNPQEEEERLWQLIQDNFPFFAPNIFPSTLPELETAISEMGQCIAKVGRMVSRVCRVFCEQHGVLVDLENILTESLNCKARLLHYFEANNKSTQPDEGDQLWCGWHNDHGSLTGLVPAMYLSTQKPQKQLPAAPDSNAGLYIHSRSNEVVKVSLPTDCIGYQIGETFQILSGGLLQATPHAVKSTLTKGVTREAFAVFLEPEYEFPMTIPEGRTVDDCCCPDNPANKALKLNSIKSRWKKGMCFGEFNNITIQTFHKQLDAAE